MERQSADGSIKKISDIVASSVPELAKVSPNFWGMSVCTVDGQRYSKGDSTEPFTLQSCSKPLTYGLAMQQLGSETVHTFVGQEPSGRRFNALILDVEDKPHNPMINPGGMIVCGLLKSLNLAADEYVDFSNEVYESEKATEFRNYAIAYLMMEKKCFPPSITVDDVLTLYYKSGSILGNCETLSVIAATLANGGVCPLTNQMVLRQDVVENMLSLMQSCGMYDYSGHFAFQIGLPAKSSLSGGMMLVVPSVMGIGLWSPPLDRLGNSCRCLYFCELLFA
ncbi:Glutaminase kidney isoform, mitochondrial [Gryllus bimaculatus]|nr:Glutaminase kidney isoform, mitochondrial [Gryllus bimaculatus]